jgi:hypothetical protein
MDLILKFNVLNLEFQIKDKHIAEMISSARAFRAKLTLWIPDIKRRLHFPHLKKDMTEAVSEENLKPWPFVDILKTYWNNSEKAFRSLVQLNL